MKVLILKTGYSETLDPGISQNVSMGDVLRSTVILHPFRCDSVTWVTDGSAYPLLKDNPYISRLVIWGLDCALQLLFEKFDIVVNLEKSPGICALASKIDAWQKYGFRFCDQKGEAEPYRDSITVWNTYKDLDLKRLAERPWQEVLFEMIGQKWQGEEYILRYKPRTEVMDKKIGLNFRTGRKWLNKSWPDELWDKLFGELRAIGYPSWQEGERNLCDYMDWINSCDAIVTNDSLGLHIAIAMGKKIVAMFGPTHSEEVYLYNLGRKIVAPDTCGHLPCLEQNCSKSASCMSQITVNQVFKEMEVLLASNRTSSAKPDVYRPVSVPSV